jgi:hypothetical protein
MRIAMITGGQPRFTGDFITLLGQLKGFSHADLYFNFWTSDWSKSVEEGSAKIEAILPKPYKLAKLQIVDEPPYQLPPHHLNHAPPHPENIRWWYKRRRGQLLSLAMAFDLIDQPYDAIVRFRLDGCIDRIIDLRTLDLRNNELILPAGPKSGFPGRGLCDQFSVGTYEGMRFFCGLARQINHYITLSDPNWEYNGHGDWSPEHLFGTYYKLHSKEFYFGDFVALLNTQGRSKYTDKHYHHRVVADPTEQKHA